MDFMVEEEGEEKKEKESEKKEEESEKEEKISSNEDGLVDKIRENPWVGATVVLFIVLIVSVFYSGGAVTGNVISGDDAGQNLVGFVKARTGIAPTVVSVEDKDTFYAVTIDFNGQETPLFVTKDGKYMVDSLVPLTGVPPPGSGSQPPQQQQPQDVPKSDKPEVELFIWSYCPYGVIAQGPMAEVAQLLGDKADFKAVLFHDGHGAYEKQQNKIQECIQKEESAEKYWKYANGFVETIYPTCGQNRDIECDKLESIKIMDSVGIDSGKIMVCVDTVGDALFSQAIQNAGANGVTGSPSVVINGVKVNVGRDAESYKNAVCNAFNSAPEECGQVLSGDAQQAAGSC